MSKIIDNICRARDILQIRDISELNKKLKFQRSLFQAIFNECHRHLSRKTKDYSYELDFTSQDLRELAQDIRNVLKRWESEMNPEKKKIVLEAIDELKRKKERLMSKYYLYQQLKQEIARTAKTKEEYERRVKALAKKLGI